MEKVFVLIGGFLFDFIFDLIFFILHVTGSGSFPKPLSAKEEKEYLEKLNQGDQNARNTLIEHNLRLVAHIIKKYYANSSDQDDLISIGTIGLIKAVDSFDTGKGIRLSSYAARCIEKPIPSQRLFWVRSRKKKLLFPGTFQNGGCSSKSATACMCSANSETDGRFTVLLQSTAFCFFVQRSSPTPKNLISNIPIRQCSRQQRTSCGTTDIKNPCSSGKSLNMQGLTKAPIFIMRIRNMTIIQ